jgi:hypothetical protein
MPNYIGSSANLLAPKFRTAGYLGITDDKAFAWWNSIS